mgnify:CR=1 FL=1
MSKSHTDKIADAAEFVVHDREFRAAVNCVDLNNDATVARAQEIRRQVLDILLRDGNDLNGRIKNLKAIGTKSPVKLKVLDFLTKQSLGVASSERHRLEFTPAEKEQKERAKELYRHARYKEALSIGLGMMKANPNLINDYSMTGLLMYCYHKLSDTENALKYARLSLKMSPPACTHLEGKVHIATECAYKLGLYEEAMEMTRKYPEFKTGWRTSCLAVRAAYKIGSYKEALEAAQFYISINTIGDFGDLYVLEIAIYSAVKTKQY